MSNYPLKWKLMYLNTKNVTLSIYMISSHQLKNNFAYQHNYCSAHFFFLIFFLNIAFKAIYSWILQIYQNVGSGNKLHTAFISIIFDFISTCIPVMRVVTGNFINGKLKLNRFFSPHFLENTVTKNWEWS